MLGVSLFANVGIGELLLPKKFQVVLANELIPKRSSFYSLNHPNTQILTGDITNKQIFESLINIANQQKIDFLIATPPCQGMSVAGKKQNNDPRNSLILSVIDFIKQIKPTYILIENVEGMLKTSINNLTIPLILKKELEPLNYIVNFQVLDTKDYSIPQSRRRVFFLIHKSNTKWNFPKKDTKIITVKEAIDHLPSLESGEKSNIPWHFAKIHNPNHILWMKHTKSGETAFNNPIYFPKKNNGEKIKGFITTYKRIDPNKPSPTITMCNGGISSQNNVHYGRLKEDNTYSDSRVLSILELMIIMTIPINRFKIPENISDNFLREVIGEAVPPLIINKLLSSIIL